MPPHGDDVWTGSWQDDHRMSETEGSYRRVRDWVESQPAATKLVFIAALDRHINVNDAAWIQALQGDGVTEAETLLTLKSDHDLAPPV